MIAKGNSGRIILFNVFFILGIFGLNQVYGQGFIVSGTKIKAPDGSDFVVKGVNVNGPYWPWPRGTVQDLSLIANDWKFNTIRVNCFPSLQSTFPNNNSDLDAIISNFTSQGIVTIIEDHDFTGTYPSASQLTQLVNWWVDKADSYKNNPYVWFNIANEPGNGGPAPAVWKTFHDTVIQGIRATGANNIIVLDGHQFGQENGYASADQSAIQTYGVYFASNYSNIIFSLHLYDRWVYGKDRLANFIQDATAKNLCLIIGEYGTAMDYSKGVAKDMFEVILTTETGRIAWHWDGTDVHRLTVNNGGWAIDKTDGSKPTNLSFVGNLIWQDNHDALVIGSTDFDVPGPWLMNGGFEDGLTSWINFGNGNIETDPSNVKDGAKAFHVTGGGNGGAVQTIYISPDSSYLLSAYGKNTSNTDTASVGVQYDDVNGVQQQHVLKFTYPSYVQKYLEFTAPHVLSNASVFIYKANVANTFYVDDVNLVLLKDNTITGFTDKDQSTTVEIFPNPFLDVLHVVSKQEVPKTITLVDIFGKSIANIFTSSSATDIQSKNITAGVYCLVLEFKTKRMIYRVVKI